MGVILFEDEAALRRGNVVTGRKVGGRAQAVALAVGKGRLVVAGEAAMFTSQRLGRAERLGLGVDDNEKFALNILHWLSRLVD